MSAVIEVNNLKKYYGDVKAVDGISFEVESGSLFGFLGINGAGKSTTINMLSTLSSPTGGSIKICEYEIGKNDSQIRSLMGIVRQENCLDGKLSVRENLALRGSFYGMRMADINIRIKELETALELSGILNRRTEKLSGGQKRRAEIAAALMNRPQILFLDEPTTGLDPATRKSVWECIEKLRKDDGITVFLTTHYMEEAAVADKIVIIDSGHILETGTPAELKEKYAGDMLRLEPADGFEKDFEETGTEIMLKDSLEALPILEKYSGKLAGFEVIHGTMDDVFLRVTGKVCEK